MVAVGRNPWELADVSSDRRAMIERGIERAIEGEMERVIERAIEGELGRTIERATEQAIKRWERDTRSSGQTVEQATEQSSERGSDWT